VFTFRDTCKAKGERDVVKLKPCFHTVSTLGWWITCVRW